MPEADFVAASEKSWCAECGTGMKEGQFCLRMYGEHLLCSESCAESFRENWVGRDFVAAHDQASQKVREELDRKPANFIFLYSDDDDFAVHSCIMALPQFVHACIPLLAEVGRFDGDVEPPPG